MKSLFEQMGGIYIKLGDYYAPDLGQFDDEQDPIDNRPKGKYGILCETFLREHHKPLYNHLLLSGELQAHLRDVQEQAQQLLDTLIPQYKEKYGINEKPKATDQMEWVRLMEMAHSICEEFIFDRIVYKYPVM